MCKHNEPRKVMYVWTSPASQSGVAEWSKAPDSRSGPPMWAWVRIPFLTIFFNRDKSFFDYIINGNGHTIGNFPSMLSHFLGEKHNRISLIYYYYRMLALSEDYRVYEFCGFSENHKIYSVENLVYYDFTWQLFCEIYFQANFYFTKFIAFKNKAPYT